MITSLILPDVSFLMKKEKKFLILANIKAVLLPMYLKAEPQYYDWMMKGEFPMNTKQKLTEIYTRMMLKKLS